MSDEKIQALRPPEIVRYEFGAGMPGVSIEEDRDWAKRETSLQESPLASDNSIGPAFGLIPWGSSQVICRMVALGLLGPSLIESDKIVEVGAGVGLPGLLIASERRRRRLAEESLITTNPPSVLLTDYHPQVLDSCRQNVTRNGLDCADVEVAILDFRAPNECVALGTCGRVDCVIAADVSYDDRLWPDLMQTLKVLCCLGRVHRDSPTKSDEGVAESTSEPPPCRCYLALEARTGDAGVRLLDLAREMGFVVEGPLELPTDSFRWIVVKETKTEGDDDRASASQELQKVRPDRYGVMVVRLKDVML